MQHRTKRDSALKHLISEFESIGTDGYKVYFEDKEFYQLIEYYENDHGPDRALEVVDLALTQYKYNSDFYLIKARLLLNLGDIEEGLQVISQGETISPLEVEYKILRAKALTQNGMIYEALNIIQSAYHTHDKETQVDLLLCEATIHESVKDYANMYDVLTEVLRLDPENEDALERIWVSVELSKKYKQSIAFHTDLINKHPYSYLAWYNLGHAYACVGEYKKAIQALEYSFIIDPDFEIGYKDCGELCFQINDFSTALKVYLEALENFENDVELLTSTGQCYIELGEFKVARKYLQQASKIDPYYDEVYYYLGQCASNEKKWASAINYFLKAIQLDDRREEYYASIAEAYAALEEYTSADYYYHKATETGPEQPTFWFQHAKFLFNINQYDAASNVIEEADYHTFGSELLYCRAAILFKQGNRQEALDALMMAIQENPIDLTILFDLLPGYEEDKEILSLYQYLNG